MTRTLSRGLAPIVEELELEQPRLVTLEEVTEIAARAGIKTSPAVLAARLRGHGWLVPTGVSGVWEFAPGAHAGPLGWGSPTVLLQAALAHDPGFAGVLAVDAAAWAHGFADRAPSRLTVAVPKGCRVPAGVMRAAQVVRFAGILAPATKQRVPVQQVETMLVHLATRPTDVRSWETVSEWLPEAALEAEVEKVMVELRDRPAAAKVRLGYLLQSLRPDIAAQVSSSVGSKVWFGPRGPLVRHSQEWQVADTVLPFSPESLSPDARQ